MSTAAARLKRVTLHLEAFGSVGHPLGIRAERGENLAQAILGGTAAHLALEDAGAPPRVVKFVQRCAPPDVAASLEALTQALGRSQARRQALSSKAFYPFTLAALAVGLGALVLLEVRPAMEWLSAAERGASPGLPLWPYLLSFGLSVAALLFLGVVLKLDRPLFPFREVRRSHECATLLAAAASVAGQGVELAVALRAATELVTSRSVKDSAEGLARSLEEGQPSFHGTLLLGELGSAIFAEAARQGVGAVSLQALAEDRESAAHARLPAQVLLAEMAGLLFAGLAIASAAACFMAGYSQALVTW